MNFYTYMITRVVPGLPVMYYIGVRQSECKPEDDITYWGSSKYLDAEIEKHGKQYFNKYILNTYDTAEEAGEDEIFMHRTLNVKDNPKFINRANATPSGFIVACGKKSAISRQRMSKASLGKPKSKAHRLALSKAAIESDNHPWRNNPKPDSFKKYLSQRNSGTGNPMYGRKHSEETRKNIKQNNPNLRRDVTVELVASMYYNDGLTGLEIANLLNIGDTTVYKRLKEYNQMKGDK